MNIFFLKKEINNNQNPEDKNETDENDETSSDQSHDDDSSSDQSYADEKNTNNDKFLEKDKNHEEKKVEEVNDKKINDHKNLGEEKNKSEKKNIKIILSVIILIVCITWSIYGKYSIKNSTKDKAFKINFDELKLNYANQNDHFWINIESCFKHSVIKSKDPSIILIIYDEETTNTYLRLTQEILSYLRKFNDSYSHVNVSKSSDEKFKDFIEKNMPDESKLYIDSTLSEHFKSGGKLAFVEDIHQFPAHSMVLFYAYGDEEKYAKFSGVLIFMSFKLNEVLDSKSREEFSDSPKKLREFAENRMFNLWSKWIGEDQLRPLFTRIANNVILINNE